MKACKAIGILLDYPTEDSRATWGEIRRYLAGERALPADLRRALAAFIEHLEATELMALQETYVELFDRSRRLSLNLFEHVHGESRDRGQAMVNLATTYRLHGWELACSEMPDYLPLFCEFLSQIPDSPARSYLAEAVDILEALRIRLTERHSPYAVPLASLISLAGRGGDEAKVAAILESEPPDPRSTDELDAEWREEPVTFGAGAALGGCQFAQRSSSVGTSGGYGEQVGS